MPRTPPASTVCAGCLVRHDGTHLTRVPGLSGVASIWVEPDGTNRIICVAGANDAMVPGDAARAVPELAPLSLVIGQFEIPQAVTAAAFAAARSVGAVTVLSSGAGGRHGGRPAVGFGLGHPNEVEFARLADASSDATDEEIAAFARRTGTRVVVTLGARVRRCSLRTGRSTGSRRPPSRRPTRPVPATRSSARSPMAWPEVSARSTAVRLGVRCASDSVQRPGTQRSFPRDLALGEFLAEPEAARLSRPRRPA